MWRAMARRRDEGSSTVAQAASWLFFLWRHAGDRCLGTPLSVLGACHASCILGPLLPERFRQHLMSRDASSKAEVIQEWADFDANGATFERGRMEANIQSLCFHEPAGVSDEMKDRHKGVKVKGSDVTSLVCALSSVCLPLDIRAACRA